MVYPPDPSLNQTSLQSAVTISKRYISSTPSFNQSNQALRKEPKSKPAKLYPLMPHSSNAGAPPTYPFLAYSNIKERRPTGIDPQTAGHKTNLPCCATYPVQTGEGSEAARGMQALRSAAVNGLLRLPPRTVNPVFSKIVI